MKRLLLVLGSATLLSACAGKSDAPALATIDNGTGGSTSTTGGRAHTGGASSTKTGATVSAGGAVSAGGISSTGGVDTAGVTMGGTTGVGTNTAATGGVDPKSLLPVIVITAPPVASVVYDDSDAGADAGTGTITGPVLIDSPVEVRCQASKATAAGAADIAPSTVQLSIKGATPKPGAKVPDTVDTYSASFAITDLPTGRLNISCTASDQAASAHSNTATVSTFIDHGPIITPLDPAVDTILAQKTPHNFKFKVAPDELVPGDDGAQVDGSKVSLTINTTTVPVKYNSTTATYSADVDFAQFASGTTPVVITASNKRSQPKAVDVTKTYYIAVDGDAPAIQITSPDSDTLISSKTALKFTVTDALSPIDVSSVAVMMGNTALPNEVHQYSSTDNAWTVTTADKSATFTFTFDRTMFAATDSQVNVSVNASDVPGNSTTSAVQLYYLDDQPPFVSLDPPNVRLLTSGANNMENCSAPFDPVGPAVPNTGTVINSFEFYRAFAWDLTNGKPSQSIFYFAGVDANAVHLYFQPNASAGIMYDQYGADGKVGKDGICDSILEDIRTMPQNPPLNPIVDRGTADFRANDYTKAPAVDASGCATPTATTPPDKMCTQKSSDMNVVVHQTYAGTAANDAAIYGVNVQTNSLRCTGVDLDVSQIVPEGWICVAAEAADAVGNVGITPPYPLCFDNEFTTYVPSCAQGVARHDVSLETPPSCIAYDAQLDTTLHPELISTHPELVGRGGLCIPPANSPAARDAQNVHSTGYYFDPGSSGEFIIVYPDGTT